MTEDNRLSEYRIFGEVKKEPAGSGHYSRKGGHFMRSVYSLMHRDLNNVLEGTAPRSIPIPSERMWGIRRTMRRAPQDGRR